MDILLGLDIPASARSAIENSNHKMHVENALSAFLDITVVFNSFLLAPATDSTSALRRLYLEKVVHAWPKAIQWLHFLITLSLFEYDYGELLNVGIEHLLVLVRTSHSPALGDPEALLTQELVASNSAIDYLFRLLTYANRARGAEYLYVSGSRGCKTLQTLLEYSQTEESFAPLLGRLNSVRSRLRRTVLLGLVLRAPYLAQITVVDERPRRANAILAGVHSLYNLVRCASPLILEPSTRVAFVKHDFIHLWCKGLSDLSQHALEGEQLSDGMVMEKIWTVVGRALIWTTRELLLQGCLDPSVVFSSVVKGGMLGVFQNAITRLPSLKGELDNSLAACVSYFTLRRVWVEAHANLALAAGRVRQAVVMGTQVFSGSEAERRKEMTYPCAHCEASLSLIVF